MKMRVGSVGCGHPADNRFQPNASTIARKYRAKSL